MAQIIDGNRFLEYKSRPPRPAPPKTAGTNSHEPSAIELFRQGIEAEGRNAPYEAEYFYEKLLKIDPNYVAARINLGTIHYNARLLEKAKKQYLAAIEVDPNYALAHFDLANVYEELGERNLAIQEYQAAIRIFPDYADAHYNLALVYTKVGFDQRKAIPHWQKYAKLDRAGPWSMYAKEQIKRLLAHEQLSIVPEPLPEPEEPKPQQEEAEQIPLFDNKGPA